MAATVLGRTAEGGVKIRSTGGVPVLEQTYSYLIKADSNDEEYLNVINADGMPLVNQTTSDDGYTICRSKHAKRDTRNRLYWRGTAEFTSEVQEGGAPKEGVFDPKVDPTTWVPIYETKSWTYNEVASYTVDDPPQKIVNSLGEMFRTGLTIPRQLPYWEFYQFEPASVSDSEIIRRANLVNADEIQGLEPHTLLLTVNSSVIGLYYGRRLRLTFYTLRYNDRNWKHKRADMALDGRKLDGSGGEADDGDDVYFHEFEIYKESDFAFLRT